MHIRWLWFDYFPPGLRLSHDERRAVLRRANELRPKGWRHAEARKAIRLYFLIWAPAIIVLVIWMIAMMWRTVQGRQVTPFQSIATGVLLSWVPWLANAYSRGKTHAPYVCRALREIGHDVCPECGYLLMGLSDNVARCPECGWLREDVSV